MKECRGEEVSHICLASRHVQLTCISESVWSLLSKSGLFIFYEFIQSPSEPWHPQNSVVRKSVSLWQGGLPVNCFAMPRNMTVSSKKGCLNPVSEAGEIVQLALWLPYTPCNLYCLILNQFVFGGPDWIIWDHFSFFHLESNSFLPSFLLFPPSPPVDLV